MTKKIDETTACISVQDLTRICNEVDREIREDFGSVFAQKRTYEKAAAYADALANPLIPVKNSWGIAEHSGYETPGAMQSLIGENKWDAEELMNRAGVKAGREFGSDVPGNLLGTGLIVDETGQGKRGKETTGVSYQYAGFAGKVVNCTTSVVLSLVTPKTRTWISGRLFLPEKTWFTGDGETGAGRRKKAGVPDNVAFATKPEMARQQFQSVRDLGIEFDWAGGDEVYGRYAELRKDHEKNNEAYAYFVPRNHVVRTLGKEERRVDELLELDQVKFETRSAGPGVNGPRYYEWGLIGVESARHFLLIRRPAATERERKDEKHGEEHRESTLGEPGPGGRDAAGELGENGMKGIGGDRVKDEGMTFCLCYVPDNSRIRPTMTNLVLMAGGRWGVEETMGIAKGPVGWDENQFRKWGSLQHHTALAALAMLKANMIRERLDALSAGAGTATRQDDDYHEKAPVKNVCDEAEPCEEDFLIPLGDSTVPDYPDEEMPDDIGYIRLSVSEIMRLRSIVLAGLSDAQVAFHVKWSKWRRKHQAVARWYHWMARLAKGAIQAGSQPLTS